MEISQYLRVLRQRWWIVALTTAAALVVAGFLAYRGANAYKTTVRVAVSMPMAEDRGSRAMPEPGGLPSRFYDPDYYNWLTSEYLADDLSEIVRSRSFAEDIGAAIGESVDPKSITDVVRTRKTHRVLTITLTASSFDRAQRLGNAIVEVLSTQSGKYLAQLATQRGQIVVIDPAETQRGEGAAAVALDIGLKTLLGLLFGLALVFALYYFDPTVRDAPDAERTLGLPILGEIPSDGARRGAAPVAS